MTPTDLAVPDDFDEDVLDDDPNLTVMEPEPEPELYGWFRVTDATDTGLRPYAVVWVHQRLSTTGPGGHQDRVAYTHARDYFTKDAAWFDAHFAYDPKGDIHRQEEVTLLMGELHQLDSRAKLVQQSLGKSEDNTFITDAGGLAGMALAKADTADSAKRAVAHVRNTAGKLRNRMESAQKELQALLEDQRNHLNKRMESIGELVKAAERAVWTINLYLGTDEEIEQISDGQPAPEGTPIAIRQKVLFMDEESAIAAERGGIDFQDIDKFDDWVSGDQKNLDQVLPDAKGIVAIKPRRKRKEYNDPVAQVLYDRENRRTYFLMRNGERLYRLWTSYDAQGVLLPYEDEFLHFFESPFGEPIKPGSEEWMKAQRKAQDAQLYFRQFFLLLQGVLDRTAIFQPIPPVQLGNPATWGTVFKLIRDEEKTLVDGSERFEDWLARLNHQLDIGMRVVGTFHNYGHNSLGDHYSDGKHGGRRGNDRISPPNAELPRDEEIYTIEGRRDDGFYFKYQRRETNWSRYYKDSYLRSAADATYRTQASCVVKKHDKFILNIDAEDCTVERMEFYLTSRLDRESYAHMFPLLRAAIAVKRAEDAAESPFRMLLAGQIATTLGVSIADAEGFVPGLVRWYKLANRHHRSLLADDAKALRMIVDEAKRQITGAESGNDSLVRAAASTTYPNALLIARKTDGDYVILIPENTENIYVSEGTVSGMHIVPEWKRWRTVDRRWQSWHVLQAASRWDSWQHNASPWENLTDPERIELAMSGWEREKQIIAKRRPDEDEEQEPAPLLLAAVARVDERTVELYYRGRRRHEKLGPLGQLPSSDIESRVLRWKRDQHRKVVLVDSSYWNDHHTLVWNRKTWPWLTRYDGGPMNHTVIAQEDENMAAVVAEEETFMRLRRAQAKLFERINLYQRAAEYEWTQRQEAVAFQKFVADYGDLELWEGHKKALKIPQFPYGGGVRRVVEALVVAGIEPGGLTLRQAKAYYDTLVVSEKPDDDVGWHRPYHDYRDADPTPPKDMEDLVIPYIDIPVTTDPDEDEIEDSNDGDDDPDDEQTEEEESEDA